MKGTLLHEFEIAASHFGDKTAIWTEQGELTYHELDHRSTALSNWLLENHLAPGERIAIVLPKSQEAVIAILAILKTGNAYAPLGDTWPAGRLNKIMEDCDFRLIITDNDRRVLDYSKANFLFTESNDWASCLASKTNKSISAPRIDRESLAYILYTSGSTGTPKGVCVSHRGAHFFPAWARQEFKISTEDRIASVAPFSFDLSTFDLFSGLSAGATVYLVPEKHKILPARFSEFLQNHQITTIYAVPSSLGLLALKGNLNNRDLNCMKTILFAGEVFPVPLFRQLRSLMPGHIEYCNLYGPTETNVCSYYRVPDDFDQPSIPIGYALPGTELFIKEDAADDDASDSNTGDLCVSSPAVMSGYWGINDSNAVYWIHDAEGKKPRAYRTGDEVTLSNNNIWLYHGRRDKMVKIWGYRVELGEVESCILEHDAIDLVAVVKRSNANKLGEELVAFVIYQSSVSGGKETINSIIQLCKKNLPPYMIPREIYELETMPLNNSGKIDRLKLEGLSAEYLNTK